VSDCRAIEIEIDRSTLSPYEAGLERGKRLRELWPGIDRVTQTLLAFGSAAEQQEAVRKAMQLSAAVGHEYPDLYAEGEGVVAGAGWNAEDYALYRHWLYLAKEEVHCCTTICLLPGRTREGRIVLAKNKDLPPVFGCCQEITRVHDGRGLDYVCLRTAGALGCGQGVNEAGFAFALSSAHTGRYGPGVPGSVLGTVLLARARSVDEGVALLQSVPRAGEASYLMADAQGNAAVFEGGFGAACAVRAPKDGLLINTNHYQSEDMQASTAHLASSHTRWAWMAERFGDGGQFGVDGVRAALAAHSHTDSFFAICRHDERMTTIASSIILPQERAIRVQFGNPCAQLGYHSYTAREWACAE
jgi:predicted choloylglycine hydrolase